MICSIYKVTCKANGKIYIGFATNYRRRLKHHKRCYKKYNYKFYNAIRKYGWNNFDWCVIYQSKDKNHTLKVMESYFISLYDSFKNGYNSTLGGEGIFGLKMSYETKQKIGMSHTGKIISDIQKEKHKKSLEKTFTTLGYIHPNTGKKKTKEHIKKQIFTKRINGKFNSDNNPMYGRKHTVETKKIQSEKAKNRQKIVCGHCNKNVDKSNYSRWHGDKCKSLVD